MTGIDAGTSRALEEAVALRGGRYLEAQLLAGRDGALVILAAGDKGFVDQLIFWRKEEPKHSEIDPTKEARRLRENAAMGDPATKGPTPVIERKKRGILSGIF